jgi:hypothetical protein
MRTTSTLLVLALLAGCGAEKPASTAAPKPDTAKADEAARAAMTTAEKAKADGEKAARDAKAVAGIAKAKTDWAAQIGDIPFSADWQTAIAQSKASKKPLLLFFTEKKSADAEKMATAAFKDPKVVEAAGAFVPAIVDAEENAPLAEQYNARTTPMVVFASPTGDVLGEAISAGDVLKEMKAALEAPKSDDAGDK